jgi:hypothetical protein
MQNNFKIQGTNGITTTYPLNQLFTGGGTNTADKFKYWKNDDGSNYITGVNNKGTYLPGAATPDGLGINGADDDGTKLGYLESEINTMNGSFGIDSCQFTEYQGPSSSLPSGGITANYLGAYYNDYPFGSSPGVIIPGWCNHIIVVMVGSGGGGASNWTNDDSFTIGGAGGGGGYVIATKDIGSDVAYMNVTVGLGGAKGIQDNGDDAGDHGPPLDGQAGGNSRVELFNSANISLAHVIAGAGYGGHSAGSVYTGGVGGGKANSGFTINSAQTRTGIQGQNGYHGDDGGNHANDWGERVQTIGGESLVGCFFEVDALTDDSYTDTVGGHLYYTDIPSAYGRGGAGSGVGDDWQDAWLPIYNGTNGANGWVRIYFTRV